MEKLLLIDGNSLLHRAFHALPLLSTSKGVYTNAVYGFTNMLFRLLQEEEPDYIAIAFDKKGPTFRHKEYAAYKATRPETRPELIGQFGLLKDVLKAMNINYVELDNYEADDLLGALSKIAEDAGVFTKIVTGDKDALQLVSKNTHVMLTKRGITEMDLYNPEKVVEKYGVPPKAIIDLKGLMGDKSDNIPGVPGVGKKTASKLLIEYETIENILENVEDLKGKVKENIKANKEQLKMSKYLATIVRDIDVGIDIKELTLKRPNYKELLKLFNELEFYSLMEKVDVPKDEADIEVETTCEIHKIDDLKAAIKKLKSSDTVGILIDAEKTGPLDYTIRGFGLSANGNNFFVPYELINMDREARQIFTEFVEDETVLKITHDGKFVRNLFRKMGIDFCFGFDTMLAAYLLDPSKSQYELENLAFEYLGLNIKDTDVGEKASCLVSLKTALQQRIEVCEMNELYEQVEMPLSTVLSDMELSGFKISIEKLEKLSDEFGSKLSVLTKEIYDLAGIEFNINSPKQLGGILFERLGLPVIKRTKTGYSTNAEVLEKLKGSHPIIEKVLDYRFLMKMKSTYADGLLELVDRETEKIYTSLNQTVTSTGRISSTEPNLQNIPVRTEVGRSIRGVFTADGPKHILLSGDYSQIELRVLAHISNDSGLIEAFNKGEDIHTRTASEVFGVPPEEVTYDLRDKAKAVNFGIVYGISDFGLAQGLGISNKEAQGYIDAYFKKYPGVRDYVRETIKSAKQNGFVTTMLNRRRYIPDINSRNYHSRTFAERVAMNTPIQGSAADIIKVAMVKVYRHLKERKLKTKMLLQIHDELIFDVPEEEVDEAVELIKNDMENAISLKVPLVVDFKKGYTWEEL